MGPSSNTQTVQKCLVSSLRVASWNTNTLGDENSLTLLFGSLHGYDPNIICVQETLLTDEMCDAFQMQGFVPYCTPATSTKPRKGENRGLMILVKSDLLVDKEHPKGSLQMGPDTETLSIRVKTSEGWYIVNNVYIHQGAKPQNLVLKPPSTKCITVGDFNSRHEEWEPETRSPPSDTGMGNRLNALIQASPNIVMANTPRIPTTLSDTTLTLSLVSPDLAPAADWQVLLDCSCQPHFATLTTIELAPSSETVSFSPRFIQEKADWNLFQSLTDQSDTGINLQNASLDDKLSNLVGGINQAALKSIPTTKFHDKAKPWECWWFNENCKQAKRNLHIAAKGNLNKLPGSRANLRQVRQQTLETYKQAKHEKWNEICQSLNLGSSLSIHWRRLRWIYNGGCPPQKPLIATAKAMANESMALFSHRSNPANLNLATRMVTESLADARRSQVRIAMESQSPHSDTLFSMVELMSVLLPFKKSSPGEDNITYQMLANLGESMLEQLLALINHSHLERRLPTKWKIIPHVPVPKSTPGEFRPIALLSCIDKVMESMQLARLKFLTGPLHPSLVGGLEGKSTADAVATVVGMASDARYKRSGPRTLNLMHCYAIFIDYEKAFELADPDSILHLLAVDKGIKGHLLGWLKDFLQNRKGYTRVQGEESDIFPLYQGTPQGSVLSPFLFNILMDKVLSVLDRSLTKDRAFKITMVAYADDLVLISNHADAPHLLSSALSKLETVSTILGLQINSSKTKAMAWTRSHFFPPFAFHIYNKQVEWVRSFKYLGVVLDDNLSFTLHAKHVCSRANKRISILKHLAGSPYGATQQTLLHYYKACIRPILEYGSIAMSIACPSAIKRIESIQNTALRIALRLPQHARTKFVRAEAGCPAMDDRFKTLAMVTWTKIRSSPESHPFHQSNKDMHTSTHLLGKQPSRKTDIPLEMSLMETATHAHIPEVKRAYIKPCNPIISTPSPFSFDIQLPHKAKNSLTPQETEELKESVITRIAEKYDGHYQVYVDGSVDPETGRSSSAFVLHGPGGTFQQAKRVSDFVSSTQAELAAIHQSLEHFQTNPCPLTSVVIHCDSHAAIQSLQRKKRDPLDQQASDILDLAHALKAMHEIIFILHWVPSHIGIPGNEQVDTLVKQALLLPDVNMSLPPTLGQVKSSIRRYLSQTTKDFFGKEATKPVPATSHGMKFSLYLALNPSLKPQGVSSHPPSVSRTLNRLRLDTDSWCYIHRRSCLCAYCGEQFSPSHYLLVCPKTSSPEYREQLTIADHGLPLEEQSMKILKRLGSHPLGTRWLKEIRQHPLSVTCSHPGHINPSPITISIPGGL